MATIVGSAAGGIWSVGASWVGGVAPTAADDVQLNATSGNITTTGGTAAFCRSLDCTGYTGTLAGGVSLTIGDPTAGAGNIALKFVAGMTCSHTGTVSFVGTSATQQTIDMVGKAFNGNVTFNGAGASWKLLSSAVFNSNLALTAGALDFNSNSVTIFSFSTAGALTRSLTMGASAVALGSTWGVNTTTGLTLSAASSTITSATATFTGGGQTYGTVILTATGAVTINGANTFTTLTRTGPSSQVGFLLLAASQTVTGVLTLTGNSAINRLFLRSDVPGTPRTVTAASVVASYVDFQDITGAGAAAPWTGTSFGDALGNGGITFDAPTTQTHTASAGGSWSDVTKWTSRIPLPQDTVVVDASTTGTLTVDKRRLGADVTFAGFAGTVAFTSAAASVYGNVVLGTGTTTSGTFALTLSGRGSKTLTSNGRTCVMPVTVDTAGGTYTLADAFITTSDFTIATGTFTTAGFTVTCLTWNQNGSGTVSNLGASLINLTSTAAVSVWNTQSGATINGGTSNITIVNASANARTFQGGASGTYGTLTYTVAGSTGSLAINQTNTFDTINFSDVTNARTLILQQTLVQTILTAFNVNGTAGKLMSITSAVPGTRASLVKSGGGQISCDYLSVKDNAGTPANTWYAGNNSTDAGNNTGWGFTIPAKLEAGAATGTSTAAGTATRSRKAIASATGTSAATGTAMRTRAEVGATTGTSTAAGTAKRTRAEAASATGTSTAAGTAKRTRSLAGSATGTSTAAGTPTRTRKLVGSATGTSAAAGTLGRRRTETGAATGTSTVAATPGRRRAEAGSEVGTSTAEGTIQRQVGTAFLFFVNALPVRVGALQHQILIGDWRTQNWVELSTITGRTFTGHLTDPSTVSFTMPGDSAEAGLLAEGISDVKWIRDGVPIFWGRLTGAVDTVGATSYDIACTCVDYRGLLENREIQTDGSGTVKGAAPLQYDNTWFVEDIIWDLINHTQTQLGGDLGITKGVFPHTGLTIAATGVVDQPLEFKNSDKIWSCIKTILTMDPSVEINIDATAKKLNVSYPFRGTDRGAKLDYGGLILSARRTVDVPGQFANFTRTWYSGEGDLNSDAQTLALPDLPSRPEGRWDLSFHAIDLSTKAGQSRAAAYNFGKASRVLPAIDMTFAPGAWEGPNAVWIGDPVTAFIRRGRLDVNDKTRIFSLTLSLDQSNVETVTVTVGLPKLSPFKSLTDDLRKLKQH